MIGSDSGDTTARPRNRRSFFPRSIAAKIFGIALGMLALMIMVAAGAAIMADRVGEELTRIQHHHVGTYGALAQADIRSLELALALRELVLHGDAGPSDAAAAGNRQEIARALRELNVEIEEGREHLGKLLSRKSSFAGGLDPAQLQAGLDLLASPIGRYERLVPALIQAVAARDKPAIDGLLDEVDRLRADMSARLEAYRSDMHRGLEHAVAEAHAFQERTTLTGLGITAIAAALGLVAAAWTTRGLVRPVRRLVSGAREVGAGSLDVSLPVRTQDEIGELTASFNGMVVELRKKQQIRETFGRYMDPRIVEGLLDHPDLSRGEGERRTMTVMFCDMRGFTGLGERLTPGALVKFINRYLTLLSEPIHRHNGVIDKYIGDAIMAYWGAPFVPAAQQAELACSAARAMLAKLQTFRNELPELLGPHESVPAVEIRFGIATGDVVVGSIGSTTSRSYTVLGDTVNVASRLEALNKSYGTTVLVGERTRQMAGDGFAFREIDTLTVAGKSNAERIFELRLEAGTAAATEAFAKALAAFRQGDWATAQALFAGLPADPAASLFLERIASFDGKPPRGWKGVWAMTTKG